mmetsp:Transcript_99056/g.317743  ORF Transcript_99056/g.317743 Transcript_99056/m.317743 type:complete len:954 (+) Transcript_99056:112-2973(+)
MEKPLLTPTDGHGSSAWSRQSSATSSREDSRRLQDSVHKKDNICSAFSHKNPVLHSRQKRSHSQACSPMASPFASPNPAFVRVASQPSDTVLEGGTPWGQFQTDDLGMSMNCLEDPSPMGIPASLQASHVSGLPSLAEILPPPPAPTGATGAAHGAVFGMINFIICVPTLISYTAIVFRVRDFDQDMPSLTKLFFLSSSVHQLIFSLVSSLPFAVGQVQDVGLLFLSQIATHTFYLATMAGHAYPEVLATVLVACAAATAITGALVWLVGFLRLSGYVQLLPLPVVGGYLGYIGYFCLAAGASLGTGLTIEGFGTWSQFFVLDAVLWSKLGLSLAFALFLFYVAYRVEHVAALPTVLVATPILFFIVLWIAGVSLEEAQDGGWIPRPDPDPAAGWECFHLYNGFQGIAWHTLPHQIPKVVGLVCVVAFGSVLDIAAIQTEQPQPLDFDGELRMIGVSNIASGFSGGFTGSYIFSQTIFSQRQRVTSSSNGWVVAIGEFLLFLMPVDVLQFFPGFYIGGVMAFFGIDIMLDWLMHSRKKVSLPEYGLLLLTFFLVMFWGVIEGCAAGVAASAVVFIVVYGTTPVVDVRPGVCSTAMRSIEERAVLMKLRQQIVCLELKGYLFFGAALQVSDKLLREVRGLGARWVVVDFTQVAGVDSTSARALAKLLAALRSDDVRITLSGVEHKAQVLRLLHENGAMPAEEDLLSGSAHITDNVDEALAWCERGALKEAGVQRPGASPQIGLTTPGGSEHQVEQDDRRTLLLREYIHPLPGIAENCFESLAGATTLSGRSKSEALDGDLKLLASRMQERRFAKNEPLFEAGSFCDGFMLIVEGTALSDSRPSVDGVVAFGMNTGRFTFEAGALLGEVDFHLGSPHSYTARGGPEGCSAAVLTRAAIEKLEEENPRTALLAHRVALRSVCLLTAATVGIFARVPRAAEAPKATGGGGGGGGMPF